MASFEFYDGRDSNATERSPKGEARVASAQPEEAWGEPRRPRHVSGPQGLDFYCQSGIVRVGYFKIRGINE